MLQEQHSPIIGAMTPVHLNRSELTILYLRKIQHDVLLSIEEPRTQYTVLATLMLVTAFAVRHIRAKASSLRQLGLPVISAPNGAAKFDYKAILDEGSRRYPLSPYLITYLGFDALHKAIGTDLSGALPIRMKAHQESAAKACESTLGPCPEWKPFRMYFTLQGIIATTNSTGPVGPDLGSSRGWLVAAQAFPMAIVVAISTSSLAPGRFTVDRDLHEYEIGSQEREKNELAQAQPDKKFPMTAWLMSRYSPEERTRQQVAHDFIVASFESTASTSATFYFIIAELVKRPALEELRTELEEVMVDGFLPQSQLSELKKMDSFMRECSCFHPFGLHKPLKLSNCPELPAASKICIDIHDIPWSRELWGNPEEFDPMRFYKLRQIPGREQRHQFTSPGPDTPGWGDGPQACTGRAFAGNTLKVTLSHLILNYEFRLPDGCSEPKRYSMSNGSS
ncbi:cytochrome P450 [Hypoxylon cercidicola]|nr:cytochrome P450 [Hypoxylon cercidicola]